MNFSEVEIRFLKKIKSEIVSIHKKCNGLGYLYEKKIVTPCICTKILKYISNLVYSNIPSDYWQLEFDELKVETKGAVLNFYTNIDNGINNGIGLLLHSQKKGIGKTSIACEIAKKAIIKRYGVYYQLMSVITDSIFKEKTEVLNKIQESDLIVIDEIDRLMIKENSPLTKLVDNFLRGLLPKGKSVILCSNSSLDELDKIFEISSLIKRYLIPVEIKGVDCSVEKNKNLIDKLKDKYNYTHKNILNKAEEYYKNEWKINEKEFSKIL